MPKSYSIAEARDNLARLVQQAETGKDVELTRRGKPVAVLIGHRDYERLVSGRRDFWDAYQSFGEAFDLSDLSIDPDETFEGARDRSPGRSVSW